MSGSGTERSITWKNVAGRGDGVPSGFYASISEVIPSVMIAMAPFANQFFLETAYVWFPLSIGIGMRSTTHED